MFGPLAMPILLEAPVHTTDHVRGDALATVTLVEYGDFECYYCALAYPIMRELLVRFRRDLRFVFRHAPQTHLHPNAEMAAQAAEAAAAQGKFWQFHDHLFENIGARDWDHLVAAATALDLDLEQFRADVQSGRFRNLVRAFERTGARSVRSTPTFFLDDVRYEGPSDLESLSAAIIEAKTVSR